MGIRGFRKIKQINKTQNIAFLHCLILKSISNKGLGETEDNFSNRLALEILKLQSDKKQQQKMQYAEAKKYLSFSYNLINVLYFPWLQKHQCLKHSELSTEIQEKKP